MRTRSLIELPVADPLLGCVVEGFTIEAALGRGGFGTVYRASDRDGAPVAFKCLRIERARSGAERRRFMREARILSRLQGRGVARLRGFGHLDRRQPGPGRPWLAQSLVEGTSLADRLRRGPRPGTVEALRLIDGVLGVLHGVHAAGVVHRDLNPGHVLLHPGGVTLVDFGLACTLDPRDALTTFTTTGQLYGTPHYMAPEQIDGRAAVGPATDLYAVGVMLFEMLAGRRPFDGLDPLTVMRAHLRGPPPAPPGLPGPLRAILRQTLAVEPSDRLPTARALRAALADVAGPEHPPAPTRPSPWGRLWRRVRRT